tara:strand:- start:2028 stop:2357 length:330 start_codon:yes stop_codon:yes gene_type:complete
MEKFIVISTTFSTKQNAKCISKKILNEKCAACIQLIPNITSFYIWKDKIESNKEFLLNVKTTNEMKDKIVEIIKDYHEYEIPQIISYDFRIDNENYKEWFQSIINHVNI